MPLPRWLAAANRHVTNRILGRIPRRFSPFVIVHHVGRTSGKRYATPVAAFSTRDGMVFTPTYGLTADWVRNVLAAGTFEVDVRGILLTVTNTRVIDRADASPYLPAPVRLAMRVLGIHSYIRVDRI